MLYYILIYNCTKVGAFIHICTIVQLIERTKGAYDFVFVFNRNYRPTPKRKCAKGSKEYRELKREVRAKLRKDNKDHIDQICAEMEECQRHHNTKNMFARMNRLTKQTCPKVKLVQNEQGVPLTEDTDIRGRWKEYCENLYKAEPNDNNSDSCPLRMGGTKEPTPSREEVEKAIKALKEGTAAGPDELPSELLKLGGDSVTTALDWQVARRLDPVHFRTFIQERRPNSMCQLSYDITDIARQ